RGGAFETISFEARLHELGVPVEDGGIGRVIFSNHLVTIKIPGVRPAEENDVVARAELVSARLPGRHELTSVSTDNEQLVLAAAAEPPRNLIVLARDPFALVELSASSLEVRRPVDLLKLGFTFDGFRLRVRGHKAVLERQRDGNVYPQAWLSVQFPSQHVAETQYEIEPPPDGPPKFHDYKNPPVWHDTPIV